MINPDMVNQRQDRYRILIAGSHYATWYLGRRFPRAVPLCFVTGYPKSGTTWATQLLADCLRLPYPQQALLPVAFPAVVHGHQLPDDRLRRGAYVMRDGRDMMVSLYFYLSRGVPEGNNPHMTREQRRWFPGLTNKSDVRKNLPAFIEGQLKRPSSSRGVNWNRHILSFFERKNSLALIRYESLLTDGQNELRKTLRTITQTDPDEQQITLTLEKFSFQRITGRRPGEESRQSFLRSGTPGDWKKYFTREAAQVFDHGCRDALRAAGYEDSSHWIDQLEQPAYQAA